MKKAVIVFSFPEPEDNLKLGLIIEQAKKVFEGMSDVRVHAAINTSAKSILDIVTPSESNLVDHAKRELSYLENDDEFNDSIVRAVQAFASYGHSGGSASYAIPVLNELLQFHNLSPLTDDPKEWNHVGADMWQSSRCSEAFSDDGGKTYYLLSETKDGADKDEHIHESVKVNNEDSEKAEAVEE